MKRLRATLCAATLCAARFEACAGEPAPPAAADPAAVAAPDAVLRDPFCPIGYRAPLEPVARAPDPAEPVHPSPDLQARARSQLRIGGIVRSGGSYVAQVNGHLVRAGDEIRVTIEGQTVVFVVQSISLARVALETRAP